MDLSQWGVVSTLDPAMDGLLEGGIPAGYVTEVTGESGSGKTQFLLSLLLAVQLPSPKGLNKRAIYISTEAPLATPRLSQYLDSNPYLSTLPPNQRPSLQSVLAINAMDLESQDHILNYQLPVAIARYNVGLVVIDSITANFRAEHSSHDVNSLSTRSGELAKLGHMLRNLAAKEDIAIVVANQVSDRFDPMDNTNPYIASRIPATAAPQPTPDSPMPKSRLAPGSGAESNIDLLQIQIQNQHPPPSSPAFPSSPFPLEEDPQFDGSYLVGNPVRNETLSLIHQQRFFTGWGDLPSSSLLQRQTPKTPALGFVWTTQIACRIALKKDESGLAFDQDYDDGYMSTQGHGQGTSQSQSQDEAQLSTDKPDPFSTAKTVRDNPEANITANPEQEQPSEQTPTPKPPPSIPPAPAPKPMERTIKRTMKLVFAPWTAGSTIDEDTTATVQDEVEFEIWTGGLRSVGSQPES